MNFRAVVVFVTLVSALCSRAMADNPPGLAWLDRARQVRLESFAPRAEPWTLSIAAEGVRLTLDLEPANVRAPHAAAFAPQPDGTHLPIPLPPPSTYRGTVREHSGSTVAASIVAGGLRVIADLADGTCWIVQPMSEFDPDADRAIHVLYDARDAKAPPGLCGTPDGKPRNLPDLPPTTEFGPGCMVTAEMAFDADYPFFLARSSSTDFVIADVESMLNALNVIYVRDVSINHVWTRTVIRTMPDPYTPTAGAASLLGQFREHWNEHHVGEPRALAHLFSGRNSNDGFIGYAYGPVVCSPDYGYSVSMNWVPQILYRAGLFAHEIGHNWGAPHCNGDSDCYIMCSGIGGCSGNLTRFGTRSIREIRAFRATQLACVSRDGPHPMPVDPRAVRDEAAAIFGQPIRIDVLANDTDANCDTLTISSWTATCRAGASVTRSVGTGPDGRDELLYTPPTEVFASDCFDYTVTDASGLSSTASVSVILLTPRAPDPTPNPIEPGLNAEHFDIYPIAVPRFADLTRLPSQVIPTVAFAAVGSGAFAGSGRAENVAATFVGSVIIPAAGDWTFYVESDDGSNLYVGDQLVVQNDGPHGMAEQSGTLSLAPGSYPVRIEYYQGCCGHGCIARLEGPGFAKQVVPASMWASPGVTATYYSYPFLQTTLPDFSRARLETRSTTSHVTFPAADGVFFGSSARRYNFGARYSGYFNATQSGIHRFHLTSDDGSALYIGSSLVVNNGGFHGMNEAFGPVALLPGAHRFTVEFFQGGGGAGLIGEVVTPDGVRRPLNSDMLVRFPFGAADCDANAVDDQRQAERHLDLGEVLAGGDGLPGGTTGVVGRGVLQTTGTLIAPDVHAGQDNSGPAVFVALDGQSGRASIFGVHGVFVPRGETTVASGLPPVLFSPTFGRRYDCIRARGSTFEGSSVTPIRAPDAPTVERNGIGIHANGGITFDLHQLRARGPIRAFRSTISIGMESIGNSPVIEAWVLVDGVVRYRRLIHAFAVTLDQIDIPLTRTDRYLTLAALEAGAWDSDHAVFADARLVLATDADRNANGVLDSCVCAADVDDGSGTGVPDGGVTIDDLLFFLAVFGEGDERADLDDGSGTGTPDGGVTIDDLLYFLTRFADGC